ncbi:uncharacterized protein LOC120171262 isoform X2 [Hibiscus syriacus]|uniref:uncharacterized protein LOC120171262 isoform X2 n=1 Tax=Hibiscus syriacus TaxID=106335 RepID=UPI0019227077|nr:uncharacterized protein LOC120171262 isoform X2 [Hibiscus syriacus]
METALLRQISQTVIGRLYSLDPLIRYMMVTSSSWKLPPGKSVIVCNQPYFYKKTELFPGSVFVIGADTVARLINPKYYDGSYHRMIETLSGCKRTGCIFIVAGRNVNEYAKCSRGF